MIITSRSPKAGAGPGGMCAARLIKQGFGRDLTLCFGGDVDLGGSIDQCLPNSVPDATERATARQLRERHPLLQRGMRTTEVWGDAIGDMQGTITAVSLSSPFTLQMQRSRTAGEATKPKTRCSHPLNVEALVDANIDVVSLGNEHSMGFREDGLLDTWEALEAAGIAHTGSGVDKQRALRPAVITSVGRRVAFFSISAAGSGIRDVSGVELWAADESRPGIAHFELWDTSAHDDALAQIDESIRTARQAGRISVVVVSICWGRASPDGKAIQAGDVPLAMRSFSRHLVDLGVNVVHGHGTGCMLGAEGYHGAAIIYSCGNLLQDEARAGPVGGAEHRSDIGYLARLVVRGTNELVGLHLAPCARRRESLLLGRHDDHAPVSHMSPTMSSEQLISHDLPR